MLGRLRVKRGCTFPSSLTWPSTKASNGTTECATTESMDGCSILQETKFVGTRLRVDITRAKSEGGFPSPLGSCRIEV